MFLSVKLEVWLQEMDSLLKTLCIDQVSCIICNEVSSDFEVDSFLDHVFISFLTGRLHMAPNLFHLKKKKGF